MKHIALLLTALLSIRAVPSTEVHSGESVTLRIPNDRTNLQPYRAYLNALVRSFRSIPEPWASRVAARQDPIAQTIADGEAVHHVPAPLFLAVGWMETHLGTANNEGGNWGAPIDMQHRHTAGPPLHAARALARSYAVCGSWVGAIGRFRSGDCRAPRHQRYVRTVVAIVQRIYAGVGEPTPSDFDEGMIRFRYARRR